MITFLAVSALLFHLLCLLVVSAVAGLFWFFFVCGLLEADRDDWPLVALLGFFALLFSFMAWGQFTDAAEVYTIDINVSIEDKP